MDGFIVQSVVQVGKGSASGIITDDSETLGLDNWVLGSWRDMSNSRQEQRKLELIEWVTCRGFCQFIGQSKLMQF
jgi:hypothetical protein